MKTNLPTADYESLSGPLACDGLPLEGSRPTTSATVITEPTTEPVMSPTPPETNADTNSQVVIVLPTSAGTPSIHGIAILVILSAVLLSCLWAL